MKWEEKKDLESGRTCEHDVREVRENVGGEIGGYVEGHVGRNAAGRIGEHVGGTM